MDWSRFREALRQGSVDPWAATVHWKDSPSPPQAPNYAQAAQTQGAANLQTALAQSILNRPDEVTPLGTRSWTQTGSTVIPSTGTGTRDVTIPTYTSNINMTPEGQNLYNQQMDLTTGFLGLGQNSLDQVRSSLGQPQDLSSVNDIADRSYALQTQRLDPQWEQREQMERTRLANQGLAPGGEAYTNAMRDFGNARNDAYNQARLSSIATMPQTYQLSTAERMQPLSEFNAIRTGAQPQMPQFQPFGQTSIASNPSYMQAAMAQGQYDQGLYNADVASTNSMNSGMMSAAATVAAAFI